MTEAEGRIRLTILGGYLGSGKTTWLRHQLHAGRFSHALIIVNEAAETPVDDALLGQSNQLEVLAGGCVCCAARDDLVTLLRRICDERSKSPAGSARLSHIVLETSGLADPGPILEAIRKDPVLVYHVVVSEVIVAVDALHCLSQLRTEPLGRRQVETADRLIITKADAADEAELKRLVATLHAINPGAEITAAAKGLAHELPDATGTMPEPLPDPSSMAGTPITPSRLYLNDDIDWTAFTVWLSALLHARGDDIVRVKGVVRTPAGRLLLQTVRKIVQSPEMLPDQPDAREDNTIVLIGRGYTADQLRRSLQYFAGRTRHS